MRKLLFSIACILVFLATALELPARPEIGVKRYACALAGHRAVSVAPYVRRESGTYGAGILLNREGAQLFAWHQGPGAPAGLVTLNFQGNQEQFRDPRLLFRLAGISDASGQPAIPECRKRPEKCAGRLMPSC